MRMYFVTNLYMRSIHAGIQSAHCLHEMYEKYVGRHPSDVVRGNLHTWAQDHKTIIILRGHGNDHLRDLYNEISPLAHGLDMPCAKFHEGELNNAITAVGVLLPEEFYTPGPKSREIDHMKYLLGGLNLAL